MSSTCPEAIPEDHAMWSVLTGELVSDAVHEMSLLSRSPALQRLYDIIVQHPCKPAASILTNQRAHNKSTSIPQLSDRACVRNGLDVGLKRRRKNSEDEMGSKVKKGKCKDWREDGVPPAPTPEANM